jgi:hypothetical protein
MPTAMHLDAEIPGLAGTAPVSDRVGVERVAQALVVA